MRSEPASEGGRCHKVDVDADILVSKSEVDVSAKDYQLATLTDVTARELRHLRSQRQRLQQRLVSEEVRRLTYERDRHLTLAQLHRLKHSRWWRLGEELRAWRSQPWRLSRLAAALRNLWRSPATASSEPDLTLINERLRTLTAQQNDAPPQPSERPEETQPSSPLSQAAPDVLATASELLGAGRYEEALERLDSLPQSVRHGRRARLLARDCYIKMGHLRRALSELRKTIASSPDSRLEAQARRMSGRIIETDTEWLPDPGPPVHSFTPASAHKVLHIVKESLPHFERGYTIRSHSTFLAQRVAGYDPIVVTSLGYPRFYGHAKFVTPETIDGIEHHRLDLGEHYSPEEIPAEQFLSDQTILTRDLAERVRPALIQAGSGYRGYETALVALSVARCLGVPFIYEVRSFLEHTWTGDITRSEDGEHYARRRAQEERCMSASDHVVTISDSMRREIVARGILADKVTVIPNIVDVNRFRPRPPDPALRRSYGLEEKFVLGYISNLGRREGIEHLIRAVALLREEGLPVSGLVVGDGPERSRLEQLVAELNLSGEVMLTGHIDNENIEDHYSLIDLFVVPRVDDLASRHVAPLKPLEAMAMGRPVLAADLPALRELVGAGSRGHLFPPGDAEALARAARLLINNDAERDRLARAGRTWVVAERDLESNARRYSEVLMKVARNDGTSSN